MSELEPLLAALDAGETTAVALVETALERIGDDPLCAFRVVRGAAARAEAAAADARRAAGERAPLLGVPVAVKDDTDVAGETTMFGCAGEFPVATKDAESVRRPRAAGAVIVGKTTTPSSASGRSRRGRRSGSRAIPMPPIERATNGTPMRPSARRPTRGRGTCSAGPGRTSPPGSPHPGSRWARSCSDRPTPSRG